MLSDHYRAVIDGEIIEKHDLAFGKLSNGRTGWGRVPPWIVGQQYCEASSGVGHPAMLVRRKDEKQE